MPNSNDKSKIQTIEKLTNRFQDLDKEKTRVATLLESAKGNLEKLLDRAEKEFGTRDITELESKLKELESENLKMRKQYQKDLDSIEKKLAKVTDTFELDDEEDDE